MSSIDFRIRFQGDVRALEPSDLFEGALAACIESQGATAGRAVLRLGLPPITFEVEGEEVSLDLAGERVVPIRGPVEGSLVVALDRSAFSELMQDALSTFGAQMTGRAQLRSGRLDDFVAWEPVLRCLLDGRPVYEPGTIAFRDRTGAPLELRRSFTLDDPREEIGHFLAEAGFLHVRRVFTEREMAEVSAELDEAIAAARRDDGASWWARTELGEWYPSRILGFNQRSAALRALLRSDRFRVLGTWTDDRFVQRDPDAGDSAEGLLKKVGVVEGISDVSWHKDCSMGGHARRCCSLTVGIALSPGRRESGELGVVAGSHRANVALLGIEGLDLPRIPLPTSTGDVTVHCSCTLHMSRPPLSAERRVVYTGFDLAPRPGDRRSPADPAEIRRERAALNDQLRRQQEDGQVTGRTGSFEL